MEDSKKVKIYDLSIVLGIAILPSIITAIYVFSIGTIIQIPDQLNLTLVISILHMILSIFLLFYVLFNRNKTYTDLGITLNFNDVILGIGVFVIAYIIYYLSYRIFSAFLPEALISGLKAKNLEYLSHFSWLLVIMLFVNPFFEELIVRGFTMTQIFSITNNKVTAVVISTMLQSSYHLYQGFFPTLCYIGMFLFFSIFYVRTGKLTPIIIAHLILDLLILFRFK